LNIHVDPQVVTTRARTTQDSRPVSVHEIAARLLNDADGEISEACEALKDYVSNRPRMLNDLLTIGAKSVLSGIPQAERNAADVALGRRSVNATPVAGKAPAAMLAAMEAARKSGMAAAQARAIKSGKHIGDAYLNYPYTIKGVKRPLRDFFGSDVRAHGEAMSLAAGTQKRNAHYLISVGTAAGDKRVSTVSAQEIERLRNAADQLPV